MILCFGKLRLFLVAIKYIVDICHGIIPHRRYNSVKGISASAKLEICKLDTCTTVVQDMERSHQFPKICSEKKAIEKVARVIFFFFFRKNIECKWCVHSYSSEKCVLHTESNANSLPIIYNTASESK